MGVEGLGYLKVCSMLNHRGRTCGTFYPIKDYNDRWVLS